MELSKHNITGALGDGRHYIVNVLSRNADIVDADRFTDLMSGAWAHRDEYAAKGYIADPEEESLRYIDAYRDFLSARENDEIQLFFVPWYACNFACSYCYQEGYEAKPDTLSPAVLDAFFRYAADTFAGRKKYITIFGGEPLLDSAASRNMIEGMIARSNAAGLDLAVVTNGYTLSSYVPILSRARLREVQVTLDGMQAAHDARRPLANGSGSFHQVVKGIDDALAAGITVNLRVVVDAENIGDLPLLAAFAKERGWTDSKIFKTQLGRNYELHQCQSDRMKLFSRLSLYEALARMIPEHPIILAFHRPAFSLAKFLIDNGELPKPLFDSCPACKTEWAFDHTGTIYSCTATVGKKGEALGTFYPSVSLDTDAVAAWQKRDVTSIQKCADCSLALACGGGCGAVAKNTEGSVFAPDCRPVDKLIGMGIATYFKEG